MSVRVACLLLLLKAASAQGPPSVVLSWSAVAGAQAGQGYSLQLQGMFHKRANLARVTGMVMYVSEPGEKTVDHPLLVVNAAGASKGPGDPDINFHATLKNQYFGEPFMEVFWNKPGEGFCRTYMNKVTGVDANGETKSFNKTVWVVPSAPADCYKEEELQSFAESVQGAFPDATDEQQQGVLDKILSIDKNIYKKSGIYEGRIYIASNEDTNFDLHNMNELCKTSGGYLVELDDPEEEWFVRDFLTSIGSYLYYTGANDVDSEGNFVFYNSKKPMTNVVWEEGEPNNGGGDESCVEIRKDGLNDNRCGRERGYICEIPLL